MPKRITNLYKINIKTFIKAGIIKRGNFVENAKVTLSDNFSFLLDFDGRYDDISYFTFKYSINGEKYDQEIYIIGKPSNLGKGRIFYFLCPIRKKPCRILYFDTFFGDFKSREAFQHRLYYPIQLRGSRERFNLMWWNNKEKIEDLEGLGEKYSRAAYYYNGKKTKRLKRIEELELKQSELNYQRWTKGMPKSLQKLVLGSIMFD